MRARTRNIAGWPAISAGRSGVTTSVMAGWLSVAIFGSVMAAPGFAHRWFGAWCCHDRWSVAHAMSLRLRTRVRSRSREVAHALIHPASASVVAKFAIRSRGGHMSNISLEPTIPLTIQFRSTQVRLINGADVEDGGAARRLERSGGCRHLRSPLVLSLAAGVCVFVPAIVVLATIANLTTLTS